MTALIDTFAKENLPPYSDWPNLLLDGFESVSYTHLTLPTTPYV